MTLTLGTGPPPVVPLPATFWLERIELLNARTIAAVAKLSELDKKFPMVASVVADLESRRAAFVALYEVERVASEHLTSMIRAAEKRAADHEAGVRAAMGAGTALPVAADVVLVEKIIQESKSARDAAYPVVELAAQDYIRAAKVAAASRAILLVLNLRPVVEGYQPTIAALHAAESRAAVADVDGAALVKQFEAEGLLIERDRP